MTQRADASLRRYEEGIDVYTAVGDGDTYSANVADCGSISQPSKGAWYDNNADCEPFSGLRDSADPRR